MFLLDLSVAATNLGKAPSTRLGAVGGGRAWYGGSIFEAARRNGQFELSAGALTTTEAEAEEYRALHRFARGYKSADELFKEEFHGENVSEAERIQALLVLSRNNTHAALALRALKEGIGVFCEKPMTTKLPDAKKLVNVVEETKIPFVLANTYTGHPMVRLAREIVMDGQLGDLGKGDIYLVHSDYIQGWQKQGGAGWRGTDEEVAGSGCMGDIGLTHGYAPIRYVTGLTATSIAATVKNLRPIDGKVLDDNVFASMELGLEDGTPISTGQIVSSQVRAGLNRNNNGFDIQGSKGSLVWRRDDMDHLYHFDEVGRLKTIYEAGIDGGIISKAGIANVTPESLNQWNPAGHNEGHGKAAQSLMMSLRAAMLGEDYMHFTGVHDGLAQVQLINAALKSSKGTSAGNYKGGSVKVPWVPNPDYGVTKPFKTLVT